MKPDLEIDLLKTDWISYKCKQSKKYSQNLYAALCNNRFFKNDEEWTCSWRYAGGLVADIRDAGEDYMDYYCSGMNENNNDFLPESIVTPEICNDLLNLGWVVKPYESKLQPGIYHNEW